MAPPIVHVQVEAPAQVAPDAAFDVVLRLRAPRGWHLYWAENPGQTGLPTRATLTGAPHAAPRWTAPTHHVGAGDIHSFVYAPNGTAVWSVTAPPAGTLDLAVETSWLACKDVCVPGSAMVRRSVRVGRARASPVRPVPLPVVAPAAFSAEGALRVCLPPTLSVYPDTAYEALGVPLLHDGAAWSATLPPDAAAALVFTEPGDPSVSWRVDLAAARAHPTCP